MFDTTGFEKFELFRFYKSDETEQREICFDTRFSNLIKPLNNFTCSFKQKLKTLYLTVWKKNSKTSNILEFFLTFKM